MPFGIAPACITSFVAINRLFAVDGIFFPSGEMMKHQKYSRVFLAALLSLGASTAFADYYVCGSTGNNNNPGTTYTSPWQTISKINAPTTVFPAGTRVLFCAGDTFEGTIVPQNGVTYGAYTVLGGPSSTPVISGSTNISNLQWTALASNPNIVWANVQGIVSSETDVSNNPWPAGVEQLTFKGARLKRARFPNIGGGSFPGVGQNRFLKIVNGVNTPQDTYVNVMDLSILSNKINPVTNLPLTRADLKGAKAYVKAYDYMLAAYNIDATADQDKMIRDLTWGGQSTALPAGNGYWLENKAWMIDQPGEWAYEDGKIYLWLPTNVTLSQGHLTDGLRASVRVHAVAAKLSTPTTFKLQNLAFADTRGDAIGVNGGGSGQAPASPYLTISNAMVSNAGRAGISVKNMTTGGNKGTPLTTGLIDSVVVNDSQAGGIELYYNSTDGFKVSNNTIRNSGIGYFAHAAIWMGHKSEATNNLVDNSAYLGIDVAKFNTITGNTVTKSCMEFNDCGGIYMTSKVMDPSGTTYTYDARGWDKTFYATDIYSTVSGNFVTQAGVTTAQAQERVDGVVGGSGRSEIKGIYLDDRSSNATILQNFVSQFDYGIMLHLARNNIVQGNLVFGGRNGLWMQEDKLTSDMCTEPAFPGVDPAHLKLPLPCNTVSGTPTSTWNYMAGNQITQNRFAADISDKLISTTDFKLIRRTTSFASVSDFATFSKNGYAGYQQKYLVVDEIGSGATPVSKLPSDWMASVPDSFSINYGPYPPAPFYNNTPFNKPINCFVPDATYCSTANNMYEMKTQSFVASFPYTLPSNTAAIIAPVFGGSMP